MIHTDLIAPLGHHRVGAALFRRIGSCRSGAAGTVISATPDRRESRAGVIGEGLSL
ncbi:MULTISPECIES: hypothetical protein [Sulfitobacter]|uniref:hypothetical protein n=1 Tax=Sulfitobacter TaxID=60136 RepID=UPI001FAC6B32|nr:hypothetical protein [Sulfitobacter dubius]WOI28934.1 hypothetical protein R1T39_14780 [Sulfitobacter dubius]